MGNEKVVFDQVTDALFLKALDARSQPELARRLGSYGLDLSRPLASAYPYEIWRKGLRAAVELRYPGIPLEEAEREIGIRFMNAYFSDTLIGKAMAQVLRVIGPARSLQRMAKNFRTGNNFVECEVVVKGPKEIHITVSDVMADTPGFCASVFEHGLLLIGTSGGKADVLERTGDAATYRVTWS